MRNGPGDVQLADAFESSVIDELVSAANPVPSLAGLLAAEGRAAVEALGRAITAEHSPEGRQREAGGSMPPCSS